MSSPHPRPLSKVEGGGDFYAETSAVLQGYGIRVIRIPNEEVFNNKENILQKWGENRVVNDKLVGEKSTAKNMITKDTLFHRRSFIASEDKLLVYCNYS